jgi:2-deoxy-D-gluconate 3-dehydrogenase
VDFAREFDLSGRTALVTGGSRGIGRSLARGVACAGARVVLTGRNGVTVDEAVDELRSCGLQAYGLVWDVTDRERSDDVVRAVLAEHGGLDILINNAGVIERAPAEDYPLDSWERVLTTNVTSAFALSRAAGRVMLERGRGRIVNIASVLAFAGGRNVVAYAASKGALVQLTRSLAAEWAARGVNVNAIAAGYVETDLTAALRSDPERLRELTARIPAGRWARPEELVGPTVFLSSDAASYVTGAVLAVDGGWLAA